MMPFNFCYTEEQKIRKEELRKIALKFGWRSKKIALQTFGIILILTSIILIITAINFYQDDSNLFTAKKQASAESVKKFLDPSLEPARQEILRQAKNTTIKTQQLESKNKLVVKTLGVTIESKTETNNIIPATSNVNKIIIPKIGVDMKISQSNNEKVMYRGDAWLIPGTQTPDNNGNSVISGHRYLYRPPSSKTFYNLDKLEAGDKIKIIWDNITTEYQVTEMKIVEPSQVEILANTSNKQLTLFTCTPLFSSKQRLVIIAKPI